MMKSKIAAVAGLTIATISSAHAELPAPAQAAYDSLSVMVDDLIAATWPIATTILVAFLSIKLIKKFARSAT
ncbi:major coat protein [Marinomonas gallaica]|uniref:major coat protein n=1 Tax=Marinomonas gallaica TaxID=1806667 RepID=UPI00082BAFA4|nr:major coat protein [Marinomonas gallaica]